MERGTSGGDSQAAATPISPGQYGQVKRPINSTQKWWKLTVPQRCGVTVDTLLSRWAATGRTETLNAIIGWTTYDTVNGYWTSFPTRVEETPGAYSFLAKPGIEYYFGVHMTATPSISEFPRPEGWTILRVSEVTLFDTPWIQDPDVVGMAVHGHWSSSSVHAPLDDTDYWEITIPEHQDYGWRSGGSRWIDVDANQIGPNPANTMASREALWGPHTSGPTEMLWQRSITPTPYLHGAGGGIGWTGGVGYRFNAQSLTGSIGLSVAMMDSSVSLMGLRTAAGPLGMGQGRDASTATSEQYYDSFRMFNSVREAKDRVQAATSRRPLDIKFEHRLPTILGIKARPDWSALTPTWSDDDGTTPMVVKWYHYDMVEHSSAGTNWGPHLDWTSETVEAYRWSAGSTTDGPIGFIARSTHMFDFKVSDMGGGAAGWTPVDIGGIEDWEWNQAGTDEYSAWEDFDNYETVNGFKYPYNYKGGVRGLHIAGLPHGLDNPDSLPPGHLTDTSISDYQMTVYDAKVAYRIEYRPARYRPLYAPPVTPAEPKFDAHGWRLNTQAMS